MALSREAYRALEDIVDPENISEDPVILDGYAFQLHQGIEHPPYGRFIPRPAAVILPESTEEVQAIVKVCNRHRIKFKAHSTGWGRWGGASSEDMIQIDLRRMNRVLEIDEENMLAVIEPYVIGAQLQAEAMKKGLNCNQIGAGSSCSVLASTTSLGGLGPTGLSMSFNGRNLLGAEWVLPSGEVMKLGSLGSGAGWFCGEGPGPSFRGIARGFIGAMGGFGVFTKCAVKLYPWPGPAVMPIEGVTPNYRSPLPEGFKDYTLAFPDWESYAEAYYKIGEAEIGYCLSKLLSAWGDDIAVPFFTAKRIDPSKTVDDIPEMMKDPEMKALIKETKISFQFTIAARSEGDFEYEEKVLKEILKETGGHIVTAFATEEVQQWMHVFMNKVDSMNLVMDMAGEVGQFFGSFTTPDVLIQMVKAGIPIRQKYIGKGVIVDGGGDSTFGCFYERGFVGHFEEAGFYNPSDHKSSEGIKDYHFEGTKESMRKGWGPGALGVFGMVGSPGEGRDAIISGPLAPCLRWQRRIIEAFDPNKVSDSTSYLMVPEELGK